MYEMTTLWKITILIKNNNFKYISLTYITLNLTFVTGQRCGLIDVQPTRHNITGGN